MVVLTPVLVTLTAFRINISIKNDTAFRIKISSKTDTEVGEGKKYVKRQSMSKEEDGVS